MKITKVTGREIFNSRGLPTLEATVVLDDQIYVSASVPSGASRGKREAVEVRDKKRLMGYGVSKAIKNLEEIIGPAFIGCEPNVVDMDIKMLELDGTTDKSYLGANTILAASTAILRAQALMHEADLYEFIAHLCDFGSVSLPLPMFNFINGGVHANNNLVIQEFMVIPVDLSTFRASMESAVILFHELKALLRKNDKSISVGDEGGFAPRLADEHEALDYIMQAIENTRKNVDGSFVLALDIAASQLYNSKNGMYNWAGRELSPDQLIELYRKLSDNYPIVSIEDGLGEDDSEGWQLMMKELHDKIQLVGDDIFVSSPERIWWGIENNISTAVLIKPNQVGTVTETLQAIQLCKDNDLNIIVSHRSGETNDTFIADLAVGASAGYIKAGGCSRGERLAKYNHLLTIEDTLVLSLLDG